MQEQWPNLPDLAQKALNSTNQAFEAVSEQELLASIASRAAALMKEGKIPDFDQIAQEAAAGPISLYASSLGKFVRLYGGGGPDFPLVAFLTSFVPAQGKSIHLGREYWNMLADVEYSKGNLFCMARLAMAVTNFTSPQSKVSDGYARLLSKTDLLSLKSKTAHVQLEQLEDLLQAAWKEVHGKGFEEHACFGRLCVRGLLHILKKSKSGHEGKTYADLTELENKFQEEIKHGPQLKASGHASHGKPAPSLTVGEAMDPMKIASLSLDLAYGKTFIHKEHGHGKVFTLEYMDDKEVHLGFQEPISGQKQLVKVPASELLSKLKATKGKANAMLPDDQVEMLFPTSLFSIEHEKAMAYVALWDCYDSMDCDTSTIQILQDGLQLKVVAKKDLKACALWFVPITSSCSCLSEKKPLKPGATIENESMHTLFHISAPKPYRKSGDKGCVAPYFLVGEDQDGQMEHKMMKHKGHAIKCLQNTSAISAGDIIAIKEVKAKEAAAPAAKKAKRK